MAQKTDLELQPEPHPSVSTSLVPEDSTESEAVSTQHRDPAANGLKTVNVLKEWPIITATVKKAEDLYRSLKTSNRIFSWSFNLAEKSVIALREGSTKVLSTFYPAIRIADLAASELAEEMQKKLPVVRQSPTEVSEAVKVAFSDLISLVVDKIEFMVNSGKTRTHNATRSVVQMYRKLVVTLDKWMEEMEKYIEAKSKGVQEVQEQTSVTEPPQINARTLPRKALHVATNVALFYVGATVWVLSRLPLIGAYLDQTPSPASSESTSPARQAEQQSSRPSSESSTASASATTVVAAIASAAAETVEKLASPPVQESLSSKAEQSKE
ncbi:uncharacterized protein LOC126313578 isoform X2 [Schistocerca gregaria]|uniref:uncharacterized protein LOC126313578 isoform X2 n=1 Tax=Schistocerca gregaria TaxID=7010 RepID=UPI00211F3AEA|nr:uncharacterized protein LOC126313578 isoform X2 [Schistocerca gregaria]